jgi:hypothetical protein
MKQNKLLTIAAICGSTVAAALNAQTSTETMPSQAEMWRIIQSQQKQIKELSTSTRNELAATRAQVEATSLAVDEIGTGGSQMPGWWENTSLGGYGELHANFNENADDKIDFHRFVLFVNHEYNDWITLYSELELEHSLAADGAPGEVELEQAFVRMDWTQRFSTDVGVYLTPVGIMNETHEPNTFYGVERNNVEKYLIPATWWEAGVKGTYRFDNGLSIDAGISSGLDSNDGYIRGGRQKVANANFSEQAFTGRINYSGIAGLNVGASVFYQSDIDQTKKTTTVSTVDLGSGAITETDTVTPDGETSGLLTVLHMDYKNGGFGLRGIYAEWKLSGDVDAAAESQSGYYIEPSYRWTASEQYGDVGVFLRFSDFEYYKSSLKEKEITTVGVNYWPVENVVLKADYQNTKGDDSSINLGFGYQF